VISEWHDNLATNILTSMETAEHPFSQVILMVPEDIATVNHEHLLNSTKATPVSINKRKDDFFDICSAPVRTEWFMITNSYHVLSEHVDLLFSNDNRKVPVIPYTPADEAHCFIYPECIQKFEDSKIFDSDNKFIVQDNDMVFNTRERDIFCQQWKERKGDNTKFPNKYHLRNKDEVKPSATTFISFLSNKGNLNNLYEFTDQTYHGKRNFFKRIVSFDEEIAAKDGESILANDILFQAQADYRTLQFAPTFTAPIATKEPTISPTINLIAKPTFQVFSSWRACRWWCSLIPTNWWPQNPNEYAKCEWKYSCSECDECLDKDSVVDSPLD